MQTRIFLWRRLTPGKQRLFIFRTLIILLLFVTSIRASSPLDGHTPASLAPGSPAGVYPLSGFENINLYNGNLNFNLHLGQVVGRGAAQWPIYFNLETTHWMVETYAQPYNCTPTDICYNYIYYPNPDLWTGTNGPSDLYGRQVAAKFDPACQGNDTAQTRLTFRSPDGTEFELVDQIVGGAQQTKFYAGCFPYTESSFNRGRTFVTTDGTAATFIADGDITDFYGNLRIIHPSGHLVLRDGTRYRIEGGWIKWLRDRNGNKLTFTRDTEHPSVIQKITDSLNREVIYGSNQITFRGFGGAPRTIRFQVGNYTDENEMLRRDYRTSQGGTGFQTYQDLFPSLNGSYSGTYHFSRVTSIELPDNRIYRLYYSPYGNLARVELPTGGAVEYDIQVMAPGGTNLSQRVIERRVYLASDAGAPLHSRTTYSDGVRHYDGNAALLSVEKHYFYGSLSQQSDPFAYTRWDEGKEYQTEFLALDGTTVLRRINNIWQQGCGPGGLNTHPRANNPRITQTTTTLADTGQVSKLMFGYDCYNNKTDVQEYDYGLGAPGALLRRTHTDYLTFNGGVNYATDENVHIRSLPTSQTVYSDIGMTNKVAGTTYEYDIYTESLTGRSGISGLCDGTAQNCPNGPNFADFNYVKRGNVTKVSRWLDKPNSTINTYQHYDVAGNVVKTVDAEGNTTTFDFSDHFGSPDNDAQQNTPPTAPNWLNGQTTFAFPTRVTNALDHTIYAQYDYFLGKPVNAEDANGIVSSIEYNDALDRPTKGVQAIGKPVARQTRFVYNDAPDEVSGNPPHSITTISDKDNFGESSSGSGLKALALYDGLGRTWRNATYEGSAWSIVETEFDALGRAKRSSNPFRNADPATTTSPSQWTSTDYDALSRAVKLTTPDNAQVKTAYSGNKVMVSDQAGKKRMSETNALGHLIKVWEITAPDPGEMQVTFTGSTTNDLNGTYNANLTSYQYDTLNNLIQVAQGSQQRWFAYDSLSRLIRARNPEQRTYGFQPSVTVGTNSAWSVAYTYDANGNLDKREAVSGPDNAPTFIETDYAYDALNRVTSKTYTGGTPAVNYRYDAQPLPGGAPPSFQRGQVTGQLVAVTYGGTSAGNYYGYDEQGRVKESFQQTAAQNYKFGYKYNRAGALTEQTYPSGRVVITGYDAAGRLNDVKRLGANGSYASQFSYAPHGGTEKMKLGNGLWEQMQFNARLQVTQIGLGTTETDTSKLRLVYGYGGTDNNGNVRSQTISAPGLNLVQTYQYDALNRLIEAKESDGNSWRQTYGYDRYGNRVVVYAQSNYVPEDLLTPQDLGDYETATNRLNSGGWWAHDAAGNQTRAGGSAGRTFLYDAENRLISAGADSGIVYGSYSYDGEGRRVQKVTGSVTTVFVYNAAGQLIAEYTNTAPGTSGTKYLTADALGSTRLVTSGSNGEVTARYDYLPFGQVIEKERGGRAGVVGYNTGETTRQRYVGYEQDSETGLDFAQARYFSSAQGRFSSVDPSGKSIIPANPQTWNRYAYNYNNPLRYVDKNGKWPTDTHNRIIRVAFDSLSDREVRQIQKGSASVDRDLDKPLKLVLENTLIERTAPRHAMTPGSMVREKGSIGAAQNSARKEAADFINQKMNEARALHSANHNKDDVSSKALQIFGEGAHTIMDNVSPAHRDFQVYDLAPFTRLAAFNPVLGILAFANSMTEHSATESRPPTADEMNQMVDSLRIQYLNTFGREMYEQAVTPEQRQETERRRSQVR